MRVRTAALCFSLIFPVAVFASNNSHGDSHGGGHAAASSHDTGGHGSSHDSGHSASSAPSHGGAASHSASDNNAPSHGGGHGVGKPHWSYSGSNGPHRWGDLAEEFSTCKYGRNQSPIDIDYVSNSEKMFDLEFNYSSVPLQIVNNGHTIQFNAGVPKHGSGNNFVMIAGKKYPLPSSADYHSSLKISGEEYKLVQVHFHSPSEHQFQGRNAPMEAHFVHMNEAKQLAVVGVMLTVGDTHPLVSQLWNYMPTHKSDVQQIAGVHVNPADLLPGDHDYNHYRGSLTTPPCSEGVRWFVMKESVDISHAQVNKFLSVIHENARPVQPLNDRFLLSSK